MLSLQEKIEVRGVESLTDAELITQLLEAGGASVAQVEELLAAYDGMLGPLTGEKLSRLRMVAGLGLKNAITIKVATELGRRTLHVENVNKTAIRCRADVVEIFQPYFSKLKYEECWVLFLSTSNRILERYKVSQGGIAATIVDYRLIVKRALELLSTQIILVHNHPSGAVVPSDDDKELTQRVKNAAALFNIVLLDHVIISPSDDFSFRDGGLIG
ncbi:MAG: DNA repair protein RadC [Rikenellaceae bacterium]